jgi:DNA primase
MLDHLIQRASDDATIPGKANTVKRVVDVLAKVRNPLVRDLYVRDLAAKLSVPVAQVMRMVRESANQTPGGAMNPWRNIARRISQRAALPRLMSWMLWFCW